jgi:DNA topoisomerase 2-associated protein PAT1
MSFFGFDPVLPERRAAAPAADEDIAVYTWGTEEYGDLGGQLQEGGDEANDETFGDMTISGDFQFANHAPGQTLASTTVNKPKKKKAAGGDLFASTEADFFGFSKKSRSSPFLSCRRCSFRLQGAKPKTNVSQKPSSVVISSSAIKPPTQQQGLWSTPAPSAAFQAAASQIASSQPAASALPAARTLAEIEQELLANRARQPMTLEEIESEMRRNLRVDAPQAPSGVAQGQVQDGFVQHQGYQAQFPAFPALGGQPQNPPGMFGQPMGMQQSTYPLDPRGPPGLAPSTTANPDLARLLGVAPAAADPADEERMNAELEMKIRETEVAEGKRRRKAEKIAGMARYNGIMTQGGSSISRVVELS